MTVRIAALIVLLLTSLASIARADDLAFSNPDIAKTPQGDSFHGPFNNESLNISASHLAPHTFIDVSFELFILRAWDGSVDVGSDNRPGRLGPDFLKMNLVGGPTLLFTTFSNRPDDPNFQQAARFQNFPSPVPGDHLAPQTGSSAKNSLGYDYPWPGPDHPVPMDATYEIHLIVPHTAASATLQLTGTGLQDIIDESWGVTNVHVSALAADKIKLPTLDEVGEAFKNAINPEVNQREAFQTLIFGMDSTADWAKINITPQPLDADQIAAQIKDLDADDTQIDTREAAVTAIRALGPAAEPFLRDTRKSATGEQRARIDWLLEVISVGPIEDENLRKLAVATRVLEIIGTPKALEVRRWLVSGK